MKKFLTKNVVYVSLIVVVLIVKDYSLSWHG